MRIVEDKGSCNCSNWLLQKKVQVSHLLCAKCFCLFQQISETMESVRICSYGDDWKQPRKSRLPTCHYTMDVAWHQCGEAVIQQCWNFMCQLFLDTRMKKFVTQSFTNVWVFCTRGIEMDVSTLAVSLERCEICSPGFSGTRSSQCFTNQTVCRSHWFNESRVITVGPWRIESKIETSISIWIRENREHSRQFSSSLKSLINPKERLSLLRGS